MPIIKSAIKKMRKDRKRTAENAFYIKAYKELIKKIKKKQGNLKQLLNQFYSRVDKAAKKHVIHKNKADRLKKRVSLLVKKIQSS
ncbi:MAG: 30S ribosomal protein S20 [Microgenomates group bacterium]